MTPGDLSVGVVGPGAVGLVVASALFDAGRRPVLAGRTPFDRIVHRRGSAGPGGDPGPPTEADIEVDVEVLVDPTDPRVVELGSLDVIFLATKIPQTPAAAGWLEALSGSGTVLAALQNGIDHRERLGRYVGPDQVVPVVVNLPAEREAPGVVRTDMTGNLVVPDDAAGAKVVSALAGSFLPVHAVEDFVTPSWTKLVINSTLGIIGVLSGAPNGVIAEPDAGALFRTLVEEAATVGRAEGADLPDDIADRLLDRIVGGAPDHRSSIAIDRAAGRPTEWESRNKVVVDRAERHGIDVPLHRAGTTLIRLGEPT